MREQKWFWTHPRGTGKFCLTHHGGFLPPDLQQRQLHLVWPPKLLTGKANREKRLMLQSTSKTGWWRLFLQQPDSHYAE